MARSPFTLAAAATAALPGEGVRAVRELTAAGEGRFDSAVVTLDDGREAVIRVAADDAAARELGAEALALRALTAGVRSMLPFRAPEYLGETALDGNRALVALFLPGFQIDAEHVPPGPGAAHAAGAAIAAIHGLPGSVVRAVGLPERSAADVRTELRELVDRAAATGHVPARLIVRWLGALDDDALWRFESTVTLGGAVATSFLYEDDPAAGPQVTGVVGWHGLSIGDPAADLAWLQTAPDAASDVLGSYTASADRAPDDAVGARARLHAELEFARWLLHGVTLRQDDIVADASELLSALAESVRASDVAGIEIQDDDALQQALGAAERLPTGPAPTVDTSMQTDAYTPDELWIAQSSAEPSDPDGDEETQRAARAALQRWTSSSSE